MCHAWLQGHTLDTATTQLYQTCQLVLWGSCPLTNSSSPQNRSGRPRTGAVAGTTSPPSVPSTIACGRALAVLGTDPHGPVSAMAEVEQPGREIRFLGQNCGHRDDGDESCGRLTANRRAVYVALAKGKDWGPGMASVRGLRSRFWMPGESAQA